MNSECEWLDMSQALATSSRLAQYRAQGIIAPTNETHFESPIIPLGTANEVASAMQSESENSIFTYPCAPKHKSRGKRRS